MLFDTVSAPKKGGKRDENVENVGKSYTVEEILHPTLHRKLPDFIGIFHIGCRKCRIFLQNFFCGMPKRLVYEGSGRRETSDFFA